MNPNDKIITWTPPEDIRFILRNDIEAFVDVKKSLKYHPMTLEGCVVRISDVIGYIGRDIEDAISLGILDEKLKDLYKILQSKEVINNTVIINHLIWDL